MAFTARRAGHKSYVTKLIKQINDEIIKDPPSQDKLESWCTEISRQKETIMALDVCILDPLVDEAAINTEISSSSDFVMTIDSAIRKCKSRTSPVPTTNPTKLVKLPNLTLPKFDGDPLKWSKFWDMFRTTIHVRTDISSTAKFQYLVAQLEGEASRLLSGFDQTDREYDEALNLLCSTYGKKRLLVQARLGALFDLSTPVPTAAGISDYRSCFEGHLRALKALDCDIENCGYVYSELLLRKLPETTRDNINRASRAEQWTLPALRDAIAKEVDLLQSLDERKHEHAQNSGNMNDYGRPAVQTSTLPVATNRTPENTYQIFCRFCHAEHESLSCTI